MAAFLGAYQADLYLRVAVGCEISFEHVHTASLRRSNVYAVGLSGYRFFVFRLYHSAICLPVTFALPPPTICFLFHLSAPWVQNHT